MLLEQIIDINPNIDGFSFSQLYYKDMLFLMKVVRGRMGWVGWGAFTPRNTYLLTRRPISPQKNPITKAMGVYSFGDPPSPAAYSGSRLIRQKTGMFFHSEYLWQTPELSVLSLAFYSTKKPPSQKQWGFIVSATTYFSTWYSSIISAGRLNFSVRNGKRWTLPQ